MRGSMRLCLAALCGWIVMLSIGSESSAQACFRARRARRCCCSPQAGSTVTPGPKIVRQVELVDGKRVAVDVNATASPKAPPAIEA